MPVALAALHSPTDARRPCGEKAFRAAIAIHISTTLHENDGNGSLARFWNPDGLPRGSRVSDNALPSTAIHQDQRPLRKRQVNQRRRHAHGQANADVMNPQKR